MTRTVLTLLLLATVATTAQSPAPSWPQWRGPARDGVASGGANRRAGCAEFPGGPRAEHHTRTLPRKQFGRGASDAAPGSRDDDDGVLDTPAFGGRPRDGPA